MKNLEEINFTDADFELMQKALGAASLKETGGLIDALLEGMPLGGSMGGLGAPSFFDAMRRESSLRQKAEQKEKREEFEESKITLQYKLLMFKKFLSDPYSEYFERRYTEEQWKKIQDINAADAKDGPAPEKKSQEPAFSAES